MLLAAALQSVDLLDAVPLLLEPAGGLLDIFGLGLRGGLVWPWCVCVCVLFFFVFCCSFGACWVLGSAVASGHSPEPGRQPGFSEPALHQSL